jgi:hypothetical protein
MMTLRININKKEEMDKIYLFNFFIFLPQINHLPKIIISYPPSKYQELKR